MKKVIGIGNALVDLMTKIDNEQLLSELNLPKGSMQLVEKEISSKIIEKTKNLNRIITSGGSAANTIHGLARLGVETAFIGKIGSDEMGNHFKNDLQKSGIKPFLLESDSNSGVAVALVSPDGERTFATFLGAAVELSENDLHASFFNDYHFLHIEGYLIQNYALIEKACQLAKANNLKISLDLASYNVVEAHRDFLTHISKDFADIIFANEEEAKAMTGKNPEEAVNQIADWCEIAVVKTGKEGSLVKTDGEIYKISAQNAHVVDTTGAGDLYAAGFIYGVLNNKTVSECGRIGSILATNVIEQIGAKIPDNKWEMIKQNL